MLQAIAVVTLIFLGYKALQSTVLLDADERLVQTSQLTAGLISCIAVAIILSWGIVKTSPGFLAATPEAEDDLPSRQPTDAERVQSYARWFIAMRWIAVTVATVLVLITVQATDWLPEGAWWPLFSTVAVLAAVNSIYACLAYHDRNSVILLRIQAYVDLGILTVLLHFSGGIENPLATMMIFHVVIAGVVLSGRQCYGIAAAAGLLFGGMAWAEWAGIVPHYPLQLATGLERVEGGLVQPVQNSLYVVARVFLHSAVLFLTAYFVTSLADRLRQNERWLESTLDRALTGQQQLEHALKEQRNAQARMVRAGRLAAAGELAGRVAHEVNNPIAIISAKARLMLSDQRDEMSVEIAQDLTKITDLADRVARIAQGLLSYCRPSPSIRLPLDLRQPIQKSLALIEQHAKRSDVKVENALTEDPIVIHGNPGEMEQVFLNLFLNALDAMPRGGTLRLSASRDAVLLDGRPGFAVAVTDTGVGISESTRDHIFEPFFTTKQEGRGTGLGLSICLGLVQSHGGELEVQSEIGKGSCFVVKLPQQSTRPKEGSGASNA